MWVSMLMVKGGVELFALRVPCTSDTVGEHLKA